MYVLLSFVGVVGSGSSLFSLRRRAVGVVLLLAVMLF
jgi:hypothetical protein